MDPITVGASVGMGALQSYANYAATTQTNMANQAMADKQMRFQRDMSNTAHQREVQDLKAAGLNPALSASGGQGASTPQGAAPTLAAPQINLPDLFAYGVSMKQMEQADKNLAIQDKLATSKILTDVEDRKIKLSEQDINKLRKQLMQKGMPEAMLHGEAAQWLGDAMKFLRKKFNTNDKIRNDKFQLEYGTPQQQRERALNNRLP